MKTLGGRNRTPSVVVASGGVSVCLIVRNEAQLLPGCLDSVQGLADEIIIVDTGSDDDTIAIAESYGATVITGGDRMHKGQARNLGLDVASKKWIVSIDADEKVADAPSLRSEIETTDALALYVRLSYMDSDDNPTMTFSPLRIWQNGTFRYKYRCHEIPVPVGGPKLAQMASALFEHRPPKEREAWKFQYSLDRLLLDVKENPGDPRPVYYLGRQYMYMERYEEAIKTTQAYIKMGGGPDTADAWFNISRCYNEMDEPTHKNRIAALHQACATAPHRREFWGILAGAYWQMDQAAVAIGLMRTALSLPMPETGQVQHGWYGGKPFEILEQWESSISPAQV